MVEVMLFVEKITLFYTFIQYKNSVLAVFIGRDCTLRGIDGCTNFGLLLLRQ